MYGRRAVEASGGGSRNDKAHILGLRPGRNQTGSRPLKPVYRNHEVGMFSAPWKMLKDTVLAFINDEALTRGAAIAFYTVTSIGPVLLIVIAIAGLAANSRTRCQSRIGRSIGISFDGVARCEHRVDGVRQLPRFRSSIRKNHHDRAEWHCLSSAHFIPVRRYL
jgi:hypothetical protein